MEKIEPERKQNMNVSVSSHIIVKEQHHLTRPLKILNLVVCRLIRRRKSCLICCLPAKATSINQMQVIGLLLN